MEQFFAPFSGLIMLDHSVASQQTHLSAGGLISRSSLSMEAEMALKLSWSSPRFGLSSHDGVSRTTPAVADVGITRY